MGGSLLYLIAPVGPTWVLDQDCGEHSKGPPMWLGTVTLTQASLPSSPSLILSAWQMKEFSGAFDTI